MADIAEQRDCARETCHIPLMFAYHHAHTYHEATVLNVSKEGMYLEAREKLDPGGYIRIRLADPVAPGVEKRCLEMDNATVVWCSRVKRADLRFFGAGISFVSADIVAREEDTCDVEYHCDMCGKRMNAGEFEKIRGKVFLCAVCHEYLSSFPEALRQRCIERFLMANSV